MGEEAEVIKERLNIADVVGEYVTLRPAGQSLKALCPFHQEKTPSFMVSPQRGTWYCFGACNEGGDIFSFVQKIEGIDFPAALNLLAQKAGVTLTAPVESHSRRQRLFDLLAAAARFYHEVLLRQRAGGKARDYLISRGVQAATMDRFQLGYAPPAPGVLQRWLAKNRYTDTEMIEAGVLGRSPAGKQYDRFRGRIIFPVADTQGRIIAFGGRIVPWLERDDVGKYINSPEGPLYEKRRVVYNLHRAKHALRQGGQCVVVEGYMDVVMLSQAGIEGVVATSGTALTADHIVQLQRHTKTLHFAFDADTAGWRATIGATQAALAAGMAVATVVLPSGKDPAQVAAENPKQAAEIMGKTQPLTLLLLEQLKQSAGGQSREEQLQALVSLITLVRNPVQQGAMVQEIAHALHVPETTVLAMLRAEQTQRLSFASSGLPPVETQHDAPEQSAPSLAELHLLGLLIIDEQVRKAVFPYTEESFFLDPACRTLYNSMHQIADHKASFFSMSEGEMISALRENEIPFAEGARARAEELLGTTANTSLQEGKLLLRVLQRRSLKSRLDSLQAELLTAGEDDRAKTLQRFQSLAEELAGTEII